MRLEGMRGGAQDPFEAREIAVSLADLAEEFIRTDAGELEQLVVEQAFAAIDIDAELVLEGSTRLVDQAGKVFRIGHLGSLTDAMMLSGLAVAEMCMADLGWPVRLGSGVAAAQDYYRQNGLDAAKAAA